MNEEKEERFRSVPILGLGEPPYAINLNVDCEQCSVSEEFQDCGAFLYFDAEGYSYHFECEVNPDHDVDEEATWEEGTEVPWSKEEIIEAAKERKAKIKGQSSPESKHEAMASAVAMLRNYLENLVKLSGAGVIRKKLGEIPALLHVTKEAECLNMWEETQEKLLTAERQRDQYMKANAEEATRAKRLEFDVEALLYVLKDVYNVSYKTFPAPEKDNKRLERARLLIDGEMARSSRIRCINCGRDLPARCDKNAICYCGHTKWEEV